MRTPNLHTDTRRTVSRKAVAFGAGLLLATTGFASAAAAAPKPPIAPTDDLVLVTPTTRATTTTTRRVPPPTRDLCRARPELCKPPVDPCVKHPEKEQPPVVLREGEGLTVRTLTTRPVPTTTKPKHCPPPSTKPDPKRPVDPPVRVKPTFTG